ncbi:hypothetical protein [Moheibacter sp.]|uniref:hypothetical protein n=1 Tax=Moheibacter sp. TaxID=1965316 RepID=UPI003C791BA5
MQKIKVKELVEFRRKSTERGKRNFAHKLKTRLPKEKKESDDESGGDYWITSTSCIYQVIKQDNIDLIDDKILDLSDRMQATDNKRSKLMHQRNIDILTSFKDFNYRELLPLKDYKIEKNSGGQTTIMLKQFPIVVEPQIIFFFERKGKKEIGAIWLIPLKEGFKKPELGMFSEMLFRFLHKNYSEHYQIAPDYCSAVDTFNGQKITYSDLQSGNIVHLIEETLEEINKL